MGSKKRRLEGPSSANDSSGGEPTPSIGDRQDLEFGLNETYAAERLVSRFGQDLRFDHDRQRWLIYRSPIWVPDPDGAVRRRGIESARDLQLAAAELPDSDARKKLISFSKFCLSDAGLKKVLSIASCLEQVAVAGRRWDNDPWLLATPNGVVDLRTGRQREGRREDLLTLVTASEFDRNGRCPRWNRFLKQVFGGDTDVTAYIQRCVGYTLTGVTTEQVWWLLHGAGANGKSTFLNVLRSVLGPYALTIPFKSVTLPERALPDDLATLPGKRFVFASEAIENARLNEARLKALTGSDSIAARHLFARWFTFEPHLKLWLSCNHLPAVQDTSEGFRRRVHVIPFRRSFPVRQRDRALESKLRAEGVGILRWAVEGCRRWQRCGLKPPQVVLDATTEYSQTFDPVSRFVAEACDRDPRLSCGATEVYQAFVEWAAEQGGPACSQREFGGKLGRRFNRTRTGEGVRYRGVGLRPYAAVRR